jgi:hypothetical protein
MRWIGLDLEIDGRSCWDGSQMIGLFDAVIELNIEKFSCRCSIQI